MNFLKPSLKQTLFICLIGLLAMTYIIWSSWRQMRYRPESRVEMKHFLRQIELGDPKSKVQKVFTEGKYKQLEFLTGRPENRWSVTTPYEFGAGNWNLYLDFDENNKLAASRLRTMDSVHEKPRETAPPDRVAPHWKKPFP